MSSSSAYSGRTLSQKLGYKPGSCISLLHAPKHYFDILGPLPADVDIVDFLRPDADMIHYFCTSACTLEREFSDLKLSIHKAGMLWVSWPKKSSKLSTDVSGDEVRRIALDGGLVDVKVCAVDADWSGLKLVYRLKDR